MANTPSTEEVLSALNMSLSLPLEYSPIGAGEGFLGNLWVASIGSDVQVVVKLCTLPEAGILPNWVHKFLVTVNPHERERAFYTLISSLLSELNTSERLPVPSFFPNERGQAIILEYLNSYHAPKLYTGLPPSQLDVAIKTLAHMHVSSQTALLHSQTTNATGEIRVPPELRDWNEDISFGSETFELSHSCCMLADTLEGMLSKEGDAFLRSFSVATLHSIQSRRVDIRPPFPSIIHGDCWCANFMLSEDDTCAVLLDFQFAKVGHVAEDLAMLLCTSVDTDERRGEALQSALFTYNSSRAMYMKQYASYWESRGLNPTNAIRDVSLVDYEKAMSKGLELIVMSFETWLAEDGAVGSAEELSIGQIEMNRRTLKARFASVVEDVSKIFSIPVTSLVS